MRVIGVDAPRGWSVLDVPNIGRANVVALGTLDEGREADELGELIAKHAPTMATIEAPIEPYINSKASDGSPAQRRSILISLLSVALLAGELKQCARAKGLTVHVVDAAHVRRAFGIRGKSETEIDRDVKAFLRTMIANWPKQSNVDERDSAIACLYAARLPHANHKALPVTQARSK
jgi:hypothetical protein